MNDLPMQIADTTHLLAEAAERLDDAQADFMQAAESLSNVCATQSITGHIASLRAEGKRIVNAARDEYRTAKNARQKAAALWLARLTAFEQVVGEG